MSVTPDAILEAHEFFIQHRQECPGNSCVLETQLDYNKRLSHFLSGKGSVFLKREDLQRVKSYKIRGAFWAIKKTNEVHSSKPLIVCASAGNHAQGVALACSFFGNQGYVFMPEGTPDIKQRKTQEFGGENVSIQIEGATFDDAKKAALEFAKKKGAVFIDPFDDPLVQAGQGTIACEIFSQNPDINTIIFPVGGGGLAAGITTLATKFHPHVKLIGVEQVGSDVMRTSLQQGRLVQFRDIDVFAEGTAVKLPGSSTFDILSQNRVPVYAVGKNRLAVSVANLLNEDGIRVETSGGLSVAGMGGILDSIRDRTIACILSGANIDDTKMEEVKKRALCYYSRQRRYRFLSQAHRSILFDDLVLQLERNQERVNWQVIDSSDDNYTIEIKGLKEKGNLYLENFESQLLRYGCHFEVTYLDIPQSGKSVSQPMKWTYGVS